MKTIIKSVLAVAVVSALTLSASAQLIVPTNTVDVAGGFSTVAGYVTIAAGFVVATITTILGLKAYGKWGSKAITGR